MAKMVLYVNVSANGLPVDGAEIALADGNFTLTDGENRRPTVNGIATFHISGAKGTVITARCYPPAGFVIIAGAKDWKGVDIPRGDTEMKLDFELEQGPDGFRPWEGELVPIRERLHEIDFTIAAAERRHAEMLAVTDAANQDRFDTVQKSVDDASRTLRHIAVFAPQDGGGFAPGGALDGAHARKKIDGAVAKVLGRSLGADPYTFLSVLRGTFPEDPVEGHIVREPVRTYISMIAESGQLSAAQGGLSREVQLIANEAKILLVSLRSISPDTDREEAEALVELIRADLDALIFEASRVDRPRRQRVTEILGDDFQSGAMADQLAGLKEALGLDGDDHIDNEDLITPVEAQLTGAMVLLERHVMTLGRAFADYFDTGAANALADNSFSGRLAFTALLLATVGQSVRDLRDTLAAVDLSQAECQTTFINADDPETTISIESILAWIESVADTEGPDLIARGGRLGLNRVLSVVNNHLSPLVADLIGESDAPVHPGLAQPSVLAALEELQGHLDQLALPGSRGAD